LYTPAGKIDCLNSSWTGHIHFFHTNFIKKKLNKQNDSDMMFILLHILLQVSRVW
jgi:hypothetical protein